MPLFGASEKDITPDFPVVVAAYHRYRGHNIETSRILDPLKVTTIFLKKNRDHQALIINLDLIWISEEFTEKIKSWCRDKFDISPREIILTATHTHSSPQIHPLITDHGKISDRYLSLLTNQVCSSIQEATSHLNNIQVHSYRTSISDLPIINRIQTGFSPLKWKNIAFHGPNKKRPRPQYLRWLELRSQDNKLEGIILNLAVHPVFNKLNRFSPDFPGIIRNELKNQYGSDIFVQYLQGFAGDIRPNYPDRRLQTRIKHFLLYSRLCPAFKNDIFSNLYPFSKEIVQKLMKGGQRLHEAEVKRHNKSAICHRRVFKSAKQQLCIQRLDIPDGPSLLTSNAELFNYYSSFLSRPHMNKLFWPVGYTNGMIGYIPDPQVLQLQSGYEYESWKTFGNPKPFNGSIIEQIKDCMKELTPH